MDCMNSLRLLVLTFVAVLLGLSPDAYAQGWPARTIQLVVPFAPGASNDVIARALAVPLANSLGQSVVVENRPGAGGSVGAAFVAKAKPDGYTLLFTSNALASTSAVQNTPYDPGKDFDAIARVAQSPFIIVTREGLPAKTIPELIAHAKAHPGQLNYGTTGVGDIIHLATAAFGKTNDLKMTAVSYQGTAPAITDLLAGRIDLMFTSYPSVRAAASRLPILAVTSDARLPLLPAIPTVRESTGREFSVNVWWAVLAPRGIPAEARERLNTAINAALSEPRLAQILKDLAATSPALSLSETQQLLLSDIASWRSMAEHAGLARQ